MIRFQGLDNLYGLFTKMDAAFQTKWLPMLSYLGPVFSYFVGSLWDKEVCIHVTMTLVINISLLVGICANQSIQFDPYLWHITPTIRFQMLGSLFLDGQ